MSTTGRQGVSQRMHEQSTRGRQTVYQREIQDSLRFKANDGNYSAFVVRGTVCTLLVYTVPIIMRPPIFVREALFG